MQLNFKKLGEGQPLLILHGLFGSLDNWMTLAKKLAQDFEVFLIDARNHGQSPHSNVFDYESMADDLYAFLMQHNIVNPIVLGHSMGGKTAMQFAMNYPTHLSQLIVVDIAPKAYPVHHQTIIAGLFTLNFEILKTRQQANEQLSQHIADVSTRQFLLKNLYWVEKEKLAWRFNLPVIHQNIEEIGKALENITVFDKPTLFIRGTQSNYITPNDYAAIRQIFTNTEMVSLDSGHWVHAEKPADFLEVVNAFLLDINC